MSDKTLGDALLKLDLSPPTLPSSAQVAEIIDRDRRRMKWLSRCTVTLWIVAALGTLCVFVLGGLTFPCIARALKESGGGSMEHPDTPFLMLAKLTAMGMLIGSLSFVVLVIAGLSTVLLVFGTRKATLRQINANLLQISEQLKAQGATPRPAGTA